MKAGLRADILDAKGHPLLYQTVPSPPAIKALLKLGVDVNRVAEDVYHFTALMRACHLGKLKSLQVLLEAGANPNAKDAMGRPLEHWIDKRARDKDKIIKELVAARKKYKN